MKPPLLYLAMQDEQKGSFFSFSAVVQAAFWTTLFSFVLYISAQTLGFMGAIGRASLIFSCHLTIFYACYSFLVPHYYEQKKYGQGLAWLVVLFIVVTPVRLFSEHLFLQKTPFIIKRYLTRESALGLVIFSEVSIAAFGSLLRLAVGNDSNKRKIASIEKMHLETELQFLKTQMTPHFLFNTINNIYSLTLAKSDKAPSAVMKLSGLLRYLLYECHGMVSIKKEAEALQDYAELFQLRYEEQVNLSIILSVDREDALLEPMLLIPLLENALKHSGLGVFKEAYAIISITQKGGHLCVRVTNNKSRIPIDLNPGGIGLQNIQKRLQTVYPGEFDLSIQDQERNFIIDLKIPLLCPSPV